ncbi:hypothetical protein RJZ56_002105 [Blastomyces dermatitidis]|uniref:Uncharacterized protein n=1 Tax=Ajellomyces dermatitidis (strain ER-3 / ATCC MYA-2586) TaxID=559297 RepID=A0ABP2EL47_AJEDR|nr:uncharacterized protein BDCG_00680 [Blastomyces dermatitidis ER-3]EEQ83875.1 hypothetical protein BDCG_00680 [Blastomyces dermatitidis ER-3]
MATTPPPRAIRTPPAPRHGARFDSYQPYSTRYSARLANRKASRGSPGLSTPNSPRSPNDTDLLMGAKRCASEEDSFSPPQSTQAFPTRRSDRKTKTSQPPVETHSFFENTRGQDDLASHSSLGVSSNMDSEHTTLTANMLPTPAKTPRKNVVPDPSAVARTLFKGNSQSKDIEMPISKRQKGRKFKGFSLESFNSELENEGNDEIAIFTDSRDRIPEVHETSDNPFISRSNDSSHGNHEIQRNEKVQEALHRDDGMLYVFRGKKIFRKFNSDTEEDDETDLGLLASQADPLEETSIPRVRPLTRSSIKPRLLFPNASHRGKARDSRFSGTDNTIDAEVACEGDEPNQGESNSDPPSTRCEDIPATPPSRSAISTPTTPLTGGRSLRSHKKEAQDGLESPSKPPNRTAVRMSPFDRWTRTKSQASPTTIRKRVGTSSSDSVEPVLKKARSK